MQTRPRLHGSLSTAAKFCLYMERMLLPSVCLGEACSTKSQGSGISCRVRASLEARGRSPRLVRPRGKRVRCPSSRFLSIIQGMQPRAQPVEAESCGGKVFRAHLELHRVPAIFSRADKAFPSRRARGQRGGGSWDTALHGQGFRDPSPKPPGAAWGSSEPGIWAPSPADCAEQARE